MLRVWKQCTDRYHFTFLPFLRIIALWIRRVAW
jgi:hypothetical protein